MAEGFLRTMAGNRFEALSAGGEASVLDPDAVAAMEEVGVDISQQRPKRLDDFMGQRVAYLVTLCEREVERSCPIFPGAIWRLKWPVENPAGARTPEERRAILRAARDQIRENVARFVREEA